VREKLTPEKFALVAEIGEDSTTPVDTRMEALGGTVYRRALKEVKRTFHDDNVAAMKADRAQLTAERAKAHAERKVKLQEKINELDSKIEARLERAMEHRQVAEAQEKAKAEFLQARAAVMKANAPHKHVGPHA
jgi:IS30 family transposase